MNERKHKTMTKMIIDNRATAKRPYEVYEIDRNEYKTEYELLQVAVECFNNDVYSITIIENEKEIIKVLNTHPVVAA